MMAQIERFEQLPVNDLVIDRFQARKSNSGERLEELADSITRWGLLQPIVVCRSERDATKWEIICGQRRFLAITKILKRDRISAGIIEGEITVEEGLALSASENIVRLDMTRKDLIDVCAELHKRYGTIKDVVQETGLPWDIVRKYIRYDGLPSHLRAKVDSNEINVDLAMKVQDAASARGQYDETEANALLSTLRKVDGAVQGKILDLRKRHPDVELEKLVAKAEEPDKSLRLTLNVGEVLAVPLKKFAYDEGMDEKAAVMGFIEEALGRSGYLNDED